MEIEHVAIELYERHCFSVKNEIGIELPEFNELPSDIQGRWIQKAMTLVLPQERKPFNKNEYLEHLDKTMPSMDKIVHEEYDKKAIFFQNLLFFVLLFLTSAFFLALHR